MNVDVGISWVKVHVSDGCCIICDLRCDRDAFEIRGNDEIDILARIWKQSHHREREERAHGTTVIVSWKSRICGLEEGGDVEMRSFSRQCGTAGIMILKYGQESRLVPDVSDFIIMKVIETLNEGCRSSESGDQRRLVVWNEARKIAYQLSFLEYPHMHY